MDSHGASQPRTSWLWIGAIWLGIGLVNAIQAVAGMRAEGINRPMTLFFTVSTLSWLVWFCATPFVIWLARRVPARSISGALTHLFACFGIAMAHSGWDRWLQATFRPWGAPAASMPRSLLVLSLGLLLNRIVLEVIIYVAILAVVHTIDSRHRLAQREAQLSRAQLDALRRQIEPHFLFNTLNAIAGLVRDRRNDAAVEMIAGLSDLLRRVLQDSGRQEVPLAEEIEFLERYLEIQHTRFVDRLRVAIDVPPSLRTAQVPSLILQPLVENAIRHGIGQRVEGGLVRVAASHDNSFLRMSVYNDGPPLPSGWNLAAEGIGLGNTRARLDSLYGAAGALEVRDHPGGVVVTVTLPYRTAPQ